MEKDSSQDDSFEIVEETGNIFDMIDICATDRIRSLLANEESREQVLESRNPDGMNPIHYLIVAPAQEGKDKQRVQIRFWFLNAASNTDHINAKDNSGRTPFDLAIEQSIINMALHILIRGGEASPGVLETFVKSPPSWAQYYHSAFISLLIHDRNCAVLVACMLLENAPAVEQLATEHPECVNVLSPHGWFVFIEWALARRCDKAVAKVLTLVNGIPRQDLFFCALFQDAWTTVHLVLGRIPRAQRLKMVLVGATGSLDANDADSALYVLQLDQVTTYREDGALYAAIPHDHDSGGLDFDIPPDSDVSLDYQDLTDHMNTLTTTECLAALIERACISDQEDLLDEVIPLLSVDKTTLCEALGNRLVTLAQCGYGNYIEKACNCPGVEIPQRTKTIALVEALWSRQFRMAAVLVLNGANVNCHTAETGWLALEENQQDGPLESCVIYTALRTEKGDRWRKTYRRIAYLILSCSGSIEFWDANNPNPEESVLCTAASAGHVNVIKRAVRLGANPAVLFAMACTEPGKQHMQECVLAALESLLELLQKFEYIENSYLISILVTGLSVGENGRGLLAHLQTLVKSTGFGAKIPPLAQDCHDRLLAFFEREENLFDKCLITLIDHRPQQELAAKLEGLGIDHAPLWLISACAGDHPPTLHQILAWIALLEMEDFADEILMQKFVTFHQRRGQLQ